MIACTLGFVQETLGEKSEDATTLGSPASYLTLFHDGNFTPKITVVTPVYI